MKRHVLVSFIGHVPQLLKVFERMRQEGIPFMDHFVTTRSSRSLISEYRRWVSLIPVEPTVQTMLFRRRDIEMVCLISTVETKVHDR